MQTFLTLQTKYHSIPKINFCNYLEKIKKCSEINSPFTSIEAEFAKFAKIAVMIVKYEIVPNMPVTINIQILIVIINVTAIM